MSTPQQTHPTTAEQPEFTHQKCVDPLVHPSIRSQSPDERDDDLPPRRSPTLWWLEWRRPTPGYHDLGREPRGVRPLTARVVVGWKSSWKDPGHAAEGSGVLLGFWWERMGYRIDQEISN